MGFREKLWIALSLSLFPVEEGEGGEGLVAKCVTCLLAFPSFRKVKNKNKPSFCRRKFLAQRPFLPFFLPALLSGVWLVKTVYVGI